MMTLEEAQSAIRQRITPCEQQESVNLAEAHGRFVARPPVARVDNPDFDNSAMDGYAYRRLDANATGGRLPIVGESSCGSVPGKLEPGTAMRIFTGAPLPQGADTVAIQEDVRVVDGVAELPAAEKSGANIRYKGEDFHNGETLYPVGHRVASMDIALLATAGVAQIQAFAKPRVLVIATGDELVPPGAAITTGQIYESNRIATIVQLCTLGADVVDGGIVKDNADELRRVLIGASEFDFVITSGGASVGDRDLVKKIFGEIGSIDFWRVKIKPGKPIAFGRIGARTHFFALPGNPLSSLVTYKLFVEPAIIAWSHGVPRQLQLAAVAANDFQREAGRMEFIRARLRTEQGRLVAEALPGQGSHMVGTLRATNGFIRLDADCAKINRGDGVTAIPLTLEIG